MHTFCLRFLSRRGLAALLLLFAARAVAQPLVTLSPIVVTAHHSEQPLALTIDPRAPAQPIPAQDGAEVLRGVAGFAVIRKGGTDGDPVLRGMAGSRLGILIDGDATPGGCGNRMDPPTAYVHPAAFQQITVLKGPQTVLHGSGYSAGVVRFEREPRRFERATAEAFGSVTLGSFGRNDQMVGATAGNSRGYVEAVATRSESGDYRTGGGEAVPSAYRRWNAQVGAGLTPGPRTAVGLVAAVGDGRAAYADRAMDGTKFERRHAALHLQHTPPAGRLQRFEARTFVNAVDHVMDNYSLRPFAPSGGMAQPAASNPDRLTFGGRALARLVAGEGTLDLGGDFQDSEHRVRSTRDPAANPFTALPRVADAAFSQTGVFGELSLPMGQHQRWVGGARLDDWRAHDRRRAIGLGMSGSAANPSADARRQAMLASGFVRLERERNRLTSYLGVGYTTRFPDYWELFSKENMDSVSAFGTRPERTTQLDTGVIVRRAGLAASVSLFANRVDDHILIENGVRKGMRTATVARNIDTEAWGGEVTASLRFAEDWSVDASLAHVRGRNRTDGLPLAQQPPAEARLAVAYARPRWAIGGLVRGAVAQRRIAPRQGNIAGQDFAPSDAFAVASLNAGWSFHRHARLAAGVDNLFDRAYAEHISRTGAVVPGYARALRVMEPGRTFWCKVDVRY
jgi:iron complex outermembrane recepter protein